ncbi:MAG: VWA domain-containing protein [Stappiaceae bacterium]
MSRFNLLSTLVLAATMGGLTPAVAQQKNVMFVLDASNSMWGQIDGKPKIDIAKSVLMDLTDQMPGGVKMGLVAYGHRFDRKLKECDDMELMNPIGHFSAAEAANSFSFITPKGQTPIANTLAETANWLVDQKGEDTTVVLISDGAESCDGDPCAAAKMLNDQGITTKIHVVGFDITQEQRTKLKCISDNGNGRIFNASNAAGLSEALNEVRTDVATTEPIVVAAAPKAPEAPEPPKSVVSFEDEFDGEDLREGWEVINPAIDSYIAEQGELLIIAGEPASDPSKEDMPNIIIHPEALPKGDWEVELKFKLEAQHGAEAIYFGVRNDHEGWLAAGVKPIQAYGEVQMSAFLVKVEGGKQSRFDAPFDSFNDTSSRGSTERWRNTGLGDKYGTQDFVLVLRKNGRSYSMSGTYGTEGAEGQVSFQTEALKMLRPKKSLFIAFGLSDHNKEFQGEGNVLIDSVRVREISK